MSEAEVADDQNGRTGTAEETCRALYWPTIHYAKEEETQALGTLPVLR
jgi:hypothetical protein